MSKCCSLYQNKTKREKQNGNKSVEITIGIRNVNKFFKYSINVVGGIKYIKSVCIKNILAFQ